MKVLFSHSYFLRLDPKQMANAKPYPPLGTILAAALLRNNDYDVRLFDTMFAKSSEEIIGVLNDYKPDVFVIYDDGFNYLTKMCLSNMRDAAFLLQQYAKAFGCTVIVTSSDAADHYEKYLSNGADFVLFGEAEYTLLETIQAIDNGTSISNINGLIYKNEDNIVRNRPRHVLKNLDELPMPAWDLVNIEPYKNIWLKNHGYFSINIATTRGCPYKCNWCAKPIYGNNYNMHSPERIVEEIILLKQMFDINHIWFCDDIFGLKRSWVKEFADFMNAVNIKIDFKIQSRADLLVQERYVSDLAKAGCKEVWMGAESGSQKILDAMEKGTTVEEIKAARLLLKNYDIKAAFFIQYGYIDETETDLNKTLDLILETMPDDIGISVSYPLPGTKFYDNVQQYMITKKNWTDSDDLDMMYVNKFDSTFYKQLHRYTHYTFRLKTLQMQEGFSFIKTYKILKYSFLKRRFKNELRAYTKRIANSKTSNLNPIIELN